MALPWRAPLTRAFGGLRLVRFRRTGWQLAMILAVLGALLGAQRFGWSGLTQAATRSGLALIRVAEFIFSVSWLLLLLAAVGLTLALALSSRRGRDAAKWLRPRLTSRPVRWGAAVAGLVMVVALVVVIMPPRFTAHRHFDKAADELKAQNDVRTTLLQALAGALLATGAYLTWRQLGVNREGQITDRYTKAVIQLGDEDLDVRIGGIYALERISRDSPQDRATIEELLTSYVRNHAPWPSPPSPPSLQAITNWLATFSGWQSSAGQLRAAKAMAGQGQPAQVAASQGPTADVHAAVMVLGRRELPPGGLRPLNLAGVDLRNARLRGAKFEQVVLESANLQDADLYSANLRLANLRNTNLERAWLDRANLQRARLGNANLQHARLNGANLRYAGLDGANLQGAGLRQANLQKAGGLESANLKEARTDKYTTWPAGWSSADIERATSNTDD